MATLYFQLERSKTLKDKTHPIYLVLKFKGKRKEQRFRYYTGRSAFDKHWIGEGEGKKVSSKAPGAGITNARLETLRLGADAIITNAKNIKAELSLDYFKDRFYTEVIGKTFEPEEKPVHFSFFDHLQKFIEAKANIFQPATIKTYITLRKSLQKFETAIGYKVEFETINHIFITLYTKYLIEDTGVINNTLAKRIATLKAFLTEMRKQKINTYSDFEDFEATRDYETTIMYLTEPELLKLYSLEVKEGSTLAHIKDAFCFACFTGIRFSDWSSTKPENIVSLNNGNGQIIKALKFTMYKVHKEVVVPLNDHALSILEKYKDTLPGKKLLPTYTNQETNRCLKELGKMACIDEVIQEVKKSGAKRITYTNAKHEILTCHDARNTFATLYLEKGGRPEVLQKLLGHSNFKQTMRYVKIVEKTVISDYFKTMGSDTAKILPLKKLA